MNIHVALEPHVIAAHAAGFTVHVPVSRWRPQSPAGHVYVTREGMPGVALMQIPSFPAFEPINIDVPVTPDLEHGSAVRQDYDGTPADAVRLLGELVARGTVETRFVKHPRMVPVDRRIPADAIVWQPADVSEVFRRAATEDPTLWEMFQLGEIGAQELQRRFTERAD